jgi:hypothetical protein
MSFVIILLSTSYACYQLRSPPPGAVSLGRGARGPACPDHTYGRRVSYLCKYLLRDNSFVNKRKRAHSLRAFQITPINRRYSIPYIRYNGYAPARHPNCLYVEHLLGSPYQVTRHARLVHGCEVQYAVLGVTSTAGRLLPSSPALRGRLLACLVCAFYCLLVPVVLESLGRSIAIVI